MSSDVVGICDPCKVEELTLQACAANLLSPREPAGPNQWYVSDYTVFVITSCTTIIARCNGLIVRVNRIPIVCAGQDAESIVDDQS